MANDCLYICLLRPWYSRENDHHHDQTMTRVTINANHAVQVDEPDYGGVVHLHFVAFLNETWEMQNEKEFQWIACGVCSLFAIDIVILNIIKFVTVERFHFVATSIDTPHTQTHKLKQIPLAPWWNTVHWYLKRKHPPSHSVSPNTDADTVLLMQFVCFRLCAPAEPEH